MEGALWRILPKEAWVTRWKVHLEGSNKEGLE